MNLEIVITTTIIIAITNEVMIGSITNIVTVIAKETTISVNIPSRFVNKRYVFVTSDWITLKISPDSALRKNS